MQTIVLSLMIFLLTIFRIAAQNEYSNKNLQQLSTNELEQYLEKSVKLKRHGTTMCLIGAGSIATGVTMGSIAMNNDGWDSFGTNAGGILIAGGLLSVLIGTPLLITGSSRTKRINKFLPNSSDSSISILPDIQYQNKLYVHSSGVKIKITF